MRVVICVVLFIGTMLLTTFFLGEQSRAQKNGKSAYHKITAGETEKGMQDTEDSILLDVRAQEEFLGQHIPDVTLIVDNQISAEAREELSDKDILIFVCYRSGRRSAGTANQLVNVGCTQVYDFDGIIGWPYETVSGNRQQ